MDTITFENIVSSPPAVESQQVIPKDVIPFSRLQITKSEACHFMAQESTAPAILFQDNKYPKNSHGFPFSDFSSRLKLTRRILIDEGVQRNLMAAACAVVSPYNLILNNDRVDNLNTRLLICPLVQFKKAILETGRSITKLVDNHTDYRNARRRSVKARN